MLRSAGLVLAAILVSCLPVAGAVYLAHQVARDAQFQRVGLLAHAVPARTITIGALSQAAIDLLNARKGDRPCSPANLALMRGIDVGSSHLQTVGHVANDRLMCSSLGNHGAGIPIGPVQFTSPRGDGIRPRARLAMVPDKELLLADRGGSATVVHPIW
jgi:sensor c-di-GMP phosphodiesterase-like protein